MEYKYYLTEDDFRYDLSVNDITETKINKSIRNYYIILLINILTIVGISISIIIRGFNVRGLVDIVCLIIFLATIIIKLKLIYLARSSLLEPFDQANPEEVIIQITDKYLIEKEKDTEIHNVKWKKIKKILVDDQYLTIIIKRKEFLLIPLRIFNEEEKYNFFELLKNKSKMQIQLK